MRDDMMIVCRLRLLSVSWVLINSSKYLRSTWRADNFSLFSRFCVLSAMTLFYLATSRMNFWKTTKIIKTMKNQQKLLQWNFFVQKTLTFTTSTQKQSPWKSIKCLLQGCTTNISEIKEEAHTSKQPSSDNQKQLVSNLMLLRQAVPSLRRIRSKPR